MDNTLLLLVGLSTFFAGLILCDAVFLLIDHIREYLERRADRRRARF